jgi:hypothetical protein
MVGLCNIGFIQRPAFPTSCNGPCHHLKYEDRWVAATSELDVDSWSTENNRLIRKMRGGLHNGPPFDETSIRMVKAWLQPLDPYLKSKEKPSPDGVFHPGIFMPAAFSFRTE